MAVDYQTLSRMANGYANCSNCGGAQALRLALLETIVNQLNPMAATDFQSLITNPNVGGWANSSNASLADLLELSLLSLIQANAGSSYYPNAGPPVGTPSANGLQYIIVDVNGRQWQYFNNQWN